MAFMYGWLAQWLEGLTISVLLCGIINKVLNTTLQTKNIYSVRIPRYTIDYSLPCECTVNQEVELTPSNTCVLNFAYVIPFGLCTNYELDTEASLWVFGHTSTYAEVYFLKSIPAHLKVCQLFIMRTDRRDSSSFSYSGEISSSIFNHQRVI